MLMHDVFLPMVWIVIALGAFLLLVLGAQEFRRARRRRTRWSK